MQVLMPGHTDLQVVGKRGCFVGYIRVCIVKDKLIENGACTKCGYCLLLPPAADFMSEHTGCPVIKGVKWNAVKW